MTGLPQAGIKVVGGVPPPRAGGAASRRRAGAPRAAPGALAARGGAPARSVGGAWCHGRVERDLADIELWERSLERSRRRRALAAQSHRTRVTRAQVSAALITSTVVAPVAPAAAQTLRRGGGGAGVAPRPRAPGGPPAG